MRPVWYRRCPGAFVVVCILALFPGCIADEPVNDASALVTEDPATHPLYPLYAGVRAAPEVRFETGHGTIRMLLYTELMPQTSARFQELVSSGFYDGTIVHRVVDDFVIQGGDPSGTGMLGSGKTIPFERHDDLHFGFGAVGLARDLDPDSGDSQWFITERPQPHLHAPSGASGTVFGSYAMYAQVFEGMDVVRKIASVSTVPGMDRPMEDVVVDKATLLPAPTEVDPLWFPTRIEGPYNVGSGAASVERPLNLFAGHEAPLAVELAPTEEGATAPADILVTFTRGEEKVEKRLAPLDDDPWVFHGLVRIDSAGDWQMHVAAGGIVGGPTPIVVETLGPALLGLLEPAT